MVTFEFTPFVLDPAKRVLLRAGVPQTLTPRAFDLLLLLVEQRDRVLSKDEILRTVWADTVVEESNLNQQVFVLRKALNGDGHGPEYIATIPRRGYRFVGEVTERSAASPPSRTRSAASDEGRQPALALEARPAFGVRGVLLAGGLAMAVVVVIGIVWSTPPEISEPVILAATALPGLEEFPSISPDGNFVAFSWTGPNPEDPPDLWIKAVDSDVLRRLTDTPEAESRPAWSPDGSQIAFLREGHGVFIGSALGGGERKIAGSGSMVGWTPDSQSLLVSDHIGDTPDAIFQIDLARGHRRQLTRPSTGIGDSAFDVSPDGRTLAFVRFGRPGIGDVFIAPIGGGDAHRRTDWNADVGGVAWTPDGRDILYSVREVTGLDRYLFRIQADGEGLERGVRALHAPVDRFSISRHGSNEPGRMAFTNGRIDVGLRLIDLERPRTGDVFENVSNFADSTRVDVGGQFSRRGDRVAFVSDRTGWGEVWVSDVVGSKLRKATMLRATELTVGGWSVDDRRLIIDAAIGGNSDLYIVDLDGGPHRRMTTEPGFDLLPDWSDDGRWIYFSSDRSGRVEVWKVPADGGRALQVTYKGGFQPQEAPDGRTIYYLDLPSPGVGGVGSTSRLKQVPIDGGDEVVILESARFGFWSVTDQGIVFVTAERESDAIDFYAFRDRQVRRLGRLPFRLSRIASLGGFRVSRDGRRALATVTDQWESDVMVAHGFR